MYRIKLQFVTAPGLIPAAYLTKVVNAANVVLKANKTAFEFSFDPLTSYRQINDVIYTSTDESTAVLDPNGVRLYEGEKARYRLAMEYPDKLVVFAFQGVGGASGGHSWFEMENHVVYYLNQNDPFNGQVGGLLHEIGHHLHLFHTFSGNYVDLTDDERNTRTYQECLDTMTDRLVEMVRKYVDDQKQPKANGLDVFNGDGLADTAPDPGPPIITYSNAVAFLKGNKPASKLNEDLASGAFGSCGGVTDVPLSVTFKNKTKMKYTLQPDKTNIMSYYQTCDNQKTISPLQQAKILTSLVSENRNYLLRMCGVNWPNGKTYFFKGPQYIRYDRLAKTVDPGYPKPIQANWSGWPSDWQSPDAAFVWPGGKEVLFIKGSQYVTYDVAKNAITGTLKSIAGRFPGWPVGWTTVDSALVVSHIVYFFRGAEYVVYSFVEGKITGSPKPISSEFDFFWPSDFDSMLTDNAGLLHVFKGNKFITYNLTTKKRVSETPIPVRGNWPGISKNFESAFVGWDGRFNFLKQNKYVPFDPVIRDTSDKFQPITNWPLPASWSSIDAVLVSGTGLDGNKNPAASGVTFYLEDEFILFNALNNKSLTPVPVKIKDQFKNWPNVVAPKVLSILKWPDGKAFFFVNSFGNLLYLVYDTKTGKLQPTLNTLGSFFTNWPKDKPNWNHSMKAVLANWWEGEKGIIYFFCGAEYLKYDVALKSVLPGYPREIEGSPWKGLEWRPAANFDNLV